MFVNIAASSTKRQGMVFTKGLNHLGLSASNLDQTLDYFIQRLGSEELRKTWGCPNQYHFIWYLM
ncbi:MAG: catechol 2,3-dioxygenase-like lactoylglutathione lyase family enzyme [Urechidicola sp.]|jgi:catechol 2,3-dioxygenase-like lactoylglutathione lyase family enzyme